VIPKNNREGNTGVYNRHEKLVKRCICIVGTAINLIAWTIEIG
jgi:hypothetical protein